MSNILTLLGIDNAQNSSHNIDAQKLAEELRVENYRFPENAYKQAEAAVKELIPLIFGMNGLKQEEFGPYLVANQGQLFTILGKYPEIFRFPLIFTEEASQSYLREALDQGVDFGVIEVGARACLGFYFYARSLRSQADLADEFRGNLFSFIYNIRNNLVIFARKVCTAELEGVWGDRDKDFFHTLFPENDPVKMRFLDQFHRPSNIVTPEQKLIIDEERFRFWSQAGLAPDRLLVAVPDLILLKGKGILSQETIQERQSLRDVVPPLDLPALNFFLCQNHLEAYEYFLTKVIANKDYYPVWKLWIRDNIGLLLDNTSQAYRVFQLVWHLEGDIFNASGGLSSDAKKRIPKDLQNVILGAAPKNAGDKLKRTVSNIPMPVQSNTAMSALLAQPVQPTKITIPPLDIKTILPDFEKSKKDNKQLTQIDFSGCDFPEGTTVQVQRRLPSKKKPVFEMIVDIDPRGKNTIKPVLGQGIQGHFGYSITVSLPSTHCFKGANSIEVSYYAKAEPTPLEIEAERARREELNNQSKAAPTPVAPVAEKVVEKVEKIIDPADTSLIAAAFVLEALINKYGNNDKYEGGPIEIFISDADASEVLGDEAKDLLPGHRAWTIAENNTLSPIVTDRGVTEVLISIAKNIRLEAQKRREENVIQRQEAEKQRRIEKIDTEFYRIGFLPSPALDNSDLRSELLARISSVQKKAIDMTGEWAKEVARIGQFCSKDYRFFHGNLICGFPASITLGQKIQGGWSATLMLQPKLSFQSSNMPKEDTKLFMDRLENALMTFAYEMLKNGNNTVEGMVHETLAREDVPKLKKKYKRELKAKKGRILIQDSNGHFHVIGGVSKDNFLQTIQIAKVQYGSQNVALLMRLDTLHFHGVDDIIKPRPERVNDTYEDFFDREVGEERRKILSARVLSTLFNGAAGAGRDSFIAGSAVDVVLSELRKKKEGELQRGIRQSDITDSFIKEFIEMLKGSKTIAAVAVTYISHRVAYCTEDDHGEFTAD